MRRLTVAAATLLAALGIGAGSAQAAHPAAGGFGIHDFEVTFTDAAGDTERRAGAHPFAMTTTLAANVDAAGEPEGWLRDLLIEQVPGLLGDTTAYRRCSTLQFLAVVEALSSCPLETAVGINAVSAEAAGAWFATPLFNLAPPPGVLLRLGFTILQTNVVLDVGVSPDPPYRPTAQARNVSQLIQFLAGKTQLWGDPSDPAHDGFRGKCGLSEAVLAAGEEYEFEDSGEDCEVDENPRPFLTLPATCAAPLGTDFEAFSWEGKVFAPGGALLDDGFDAGSVLTHDAGGAPRAFLDCGGLSPFSPRIEAEPTARAAESPTGLDFSLTVEDENLTSVGGRSQSLIEKAVVTLPEGMTANPSLAEGLEVCSEADLDREELGSGTGAGCPQASKIGAIEVQSPLIAEPVEGSLYQAEPYANRAGDALIAFYIVIKNPRLGIIVKQPVRVEADPETGQLRAITEDIPQLAFSEFRLKFREGGRSPLVTPPTCGSHEVSAELTPWSGQAPVIDTSTFRIVSGPGEGPCPPGGSQPFAPGFEAGSANNAAATYSPFAMRLTRRDGDQDLTRFDAVLPHGVSARLAGVARCPEAAIALAGAKSGRAELAAPSCPPASAIGSVWAGAGVGSQLTYVRGRVYLAGPYGGAPLSAVALTPAVAGPFDVGTVVYRQALRVDPRTAEVTADGALSDPLPHILAGIPLRVRDIQVSVDRPGFTLNPTSCDPMATRAGIWGGGSDPFSVADDAPVLAQAPFQAASCRSLGFAPRVALRLKGATKRGGFPALRTVYRPREGHANVNRLALRFPRSAFIEQGHFRTICTRVQYAAGACPRGSIYGRARAFTPLLEEPLEGPVYLRSSDNELPDAVLALKGLVDVEAVVRIDSVRGGLRATVTGAPDVPVSRVVVNMRGGQKGLFVNSKDLCRSRNRANANLAAHSGARATLRPLVRPRCGRRR